jgi:hypothetical protein
MYSLGQTETGRLYIRHPRIPALAWSAEANDWVPLTPLFQGRSFNALTFDTEQELEDYVNDNELYPRRD